MVMMTAATSATTGQNSLAQWGRMSRMICSLSLRSFDGNGTREAYAAPLRLAANAGLSIDLARKDGAPRDDAVEEQQAVEMVELMQESPGLEGVDLEHPLFSLRRDPADNE